MRPEDQVGEDHPWAALLGEWSIEGTHPGLPGTVVHGHAVFEWLADQRLLIQRSHYDHPDIPDALAVTGILDGTPTMHYFDPRGVHRVFQVEITAGTWRYRNETPGFAQRFTGTLSPDGDAIVGHGELSRDGVTWHDDLDITFRRTG